MIKRLSLLVLLVVIALLEVNAQSFYSARRDRTLMLVVGTGTSTYFGELSNPGDYMDAKPNINVGLQYYISQRVIVRAEATWFQLSGDDKKANDESRKARNLNFIANNYEIAATGAFHLFPHGRRFYQRPFFNAYGFAGLGFMYMNPKAILPDGSREALQPLQTEGVSYSKLQLVIPYGLGIKLKVTPFFNLAIEGGYRMTFTDYIDDVSTTHPDKSTWTNAKAIALSDRGPEIGQSPRSSGAIRGNPDTNDGYFLMNAKIEYYLPSSFGKKKHSAFKKKKRRPSYASKRRRRR